MTVDSETAGRLGIYDIPFEQIEKYIQGDVKYIADVIVSRTLRNRNLNFDWLYILSDLPENITIAFLGTKEEYHSFCELTCLGSKVAYYPTANLYEVSQIIKGCKVFIGNYSTLYVIAEKLEISRIQETTSYIPKPGINNNNAIETGCRNDLYLSKVKLFDWLGLDTSLIGKIPQKTLLYTTCYVSNEYQLDRICGWVDYYLPRMGKLGATNIIIVDDGSPQEWLDKIIERYGNTNIYFNRLDSYYNQKTVSNDLIKVNSININIKHETAKISIISFNDNLGRPHYQLYPGWWRSYSFGAFVADFFKFDKFIFIESDAYIYTGRLFNWLQNTNTGFNSLYSRISNYRESNIQICMKSEYYKIIKYFQINGFLNQDFWWCFERRAIDYIPEHILPWTNNLEDVKQFKIDRFGDDQYKEIPADADGCCNLTDISLNHRFHKNESAKLIQHNEIINKLSTKVDLNSVTA